jgi:hypothetical protein
LSLELKRQIKQAQEAHERIQQFERQMRSQRQTLEDRERELKKARDQIDTLLVRRKVEPGAGTTPKPAASSTGASQIPLLEGQAGLGNAEEEDYPAWYWKWRTNSSYERDIRFLQTLGATGYCRLTELRDEFEYRGHGTESTMYRAVSSCEKWELVERVGAVARTRGRPTSVIILTERGKWCYQTETGSAPKRNEYETLIKAHKNPNHLALILQAAEAFAQLGFAVDREPRRIAVDKERGKYFFPDLTVSDPQTSELLFLEVERGGGRRKEANIHKWDNASSAAAGKIWIVADKVNTLNTRIGEVMYWATENRRAVQVWGTTVEHISNLSPGDGRIWIRHKDLRRKF